MLAEASKHFKELRWKGLGAIFGQSIAQCRDQPFLLSILMKKRGNRLILRLQELHDGRGRLVACDCVIRREIEIGGGHDRP
ncbi:MAG: hypothetical protein RSP_04860 [Rhodanobacter sp.]